jgi:hypothetical protein
VRRVRGGAVPSSGLLGERPFESSQLEAPEQKSSIGAHAAGAIAAGDTVILDVGTTTAAIARALVLRTELRDVTVVTNGLNIALELERAAPRISVVVTGGTLRPLQHSLVNPLGTVLLERLHASGAFVGCNGVDPEFGITNINLPEAEVKRAMLLAARRRVIVAAGVEELQTPYLRPQENGNRRDVRWATIGDGHGTAIRLEGEPTFDLTVRPWTSEHLDQARHPTDLRSDDRVWVNLDHAQQGIGSASCGPGVLPAYRLDPAPATFAARLLRGPPDPA